MFCDVSGIIHFIGHTLALAETNDDIELGVFGELKAAEAYLRAGRLVEMEEYFEVGISGEDTDLGVLRAHCDSLVLALNVVDRDRHVERRCYFISVQYPLLFTDKGVLFM
jgi:hypothetical protein